MRMGTSDLETIDSKGGIERKVIDIHVHPQFTPGRVYYDVGIAVANEFITFTNFIRPVCLPYLPVDNSNYFEEESVILANWEYGIQASNKLNETTTVSNLRLRSLRVSKIVST